MSVVPVGCCDVHPPLLHWLPRTVRGVHQLLGYRGALDGQCRCTSASAARASLLMILLIYSFLRPLRGVRWLASRGRATRRCVASAVRKRGTFDGQCGCTSASAARGSSLATEYGQRAGEWRAKSAKLRGTFDGLEERERHAEEDDHAFHQETVPHSDHRRPLRSAPVRPSPLEKKRGGE